MQNNESKVFTFRLPNDLRSKLEKKKKKEGRSLANLIIFILKEAIQND